MERAEATGLGVALVGHGALLALLSLGFATVKQAPVLNEPMEVSIVEEVALRAAAPQPAAQAPAPSAAPEPSLPEEPAPAPAPAPDPAPPAPPPPPPRAEPIPLPPQPKPVPKALPPSPRPAPVKATPVKPAPPKIVPSKPALSGAGKAPTRRPLDRNILAGVGSDPAPAKPSPAPAAAISPVQLAGIRSAIQRQIQPCADRQVNPGPGANQIQVTLNLRLNPDGSLAASPTVVRTSGVTPDNDRYEERVADLAIAAYRGCSPLRGLPDTLYRTAGGGWSNINMNYKLPG